MKIWFDRILSLWTISIGMGAIIISFIERGILPDSTLKVFPKFFFLVFGVVLTIVGFKKLTKLYQPLPGIPVNPTKVAILYDTIGLLFGIASAIAFFDWLLPTLLGLEEIVNDEMLVFMGSFFLIFGIPFLSLYTTRFTAQSLEINSKGITLHSFNKTTDLDWQQLDKIDFKNEYVAVGRVGVLVPKKLQKQLQLTTKGGQTLRINEPQLKAGKAGLVASLLKHVPDNLKK